MNTHTDIALGFLNQPFITLTESKMLNVWYGDHTDKTFTLTQNGFVMNGISKEYLQKNNLL